MFSPQVAVPPKMDRQTATVVGRDWSAPCYLVKQFSEDRPTIDDFLLEDVFAIRPQGTDLPALCHGRAANPEGAAAMQPHAVARSHEEALCPAAAVADTARFPDDCEWRRLRQRRLSLQQRSGQTVVKRGARGEAVVCTKQITFCQFGLTVERQRRLATRDLPHAIWVDSNAEKIAWQGSRRYEQMCSTQCRQLHRVALERYCGSMYGSRVVALDDSDGGQEY